MIFEGQNQEKDAFPPRPLKLCSNEGQGEGLNI